MKTRVVTGIGLILPLLIITARADTPKQVESRLHKHLTFLTSGACEGRGIETKGIERAEEYIARAFADAGLKPGGGKGSYYQTFQLTMGAKIGKVNRVVVTGPQKQTIALRMQKDFVVLPLGSKGKVTAPVVFAGYGLSAPELKYDDFKGLNVKGKIVILLPNTPRYRHPLADMFAKADEKRNDRYRDLRTRLANAERHKAAAVILVNDRKSAARRRDAFVSTRYSARQGNPVGIPVVHMKRRVVDNMLRSAALTTLAKLEKLIDADMKPRTMELRGWKCQIETDVEHTTYTVRNVIGVVEGSGPLKDETIIIGAHHDHMGKGTGRNSLRRGTSSPGGIGGAGFPLAEMNVGPIFHGADDNASGSSCIMELARRFGKRKDGRRIVLMTFTAEEKGLLGSRYYCRYPIFPLTTTAAMVNLDMVGRMQEKKVLVSGLGTAKPFRPLIDRLNKRHKLALVKRDPSGGSSDHASFLARKIPIFSFFTGFHEQYHRPTDQLPTINVAGMRQIVDLVEDVVVELRTMERPVFMQPKGFVNRRTTLWASAASIGILPNYDFEGSGVQVEGIVPATPAAKAKILAGDRVTAIDGKTLTGLTDYLAKTRHLKSGQEFKFTVVRKGKTVEVGLKTLKARKGMPVTRLGIRMDTTPLRRRTPFKNGLRIIGVEKKSPAAKAGVKVGDRLISIGDIDIKSRSAFFSAFRLVQSNSKIKVGISRNGKLQQLELKLKAPAPKKKGKSDPKKKNNEPVGKEGLVTMLTHPRLTFRIPTLNPFSEFGWIFE